MRFSTRLYLGFGIMLFLMTILLVVNINLSNNQNKEINELVKNRYERIKHLVNTTREAIYIHADVEGDIGTLSSTSYDSLNNRIRSLYHSLDRLVELSPNSPENDQIAILKQRSEDYIVQVEQILLKRSLGNTENEPGELLVAETLKNTIVSYSESLIRDQEIAMDDTLAEADSTLQTAVYMGIVSIALAVLFGVALSFWSISKITKRLRKVKAVMNSVENGSEQLPRIPIINTDEIGEIAQAYNEMAATLEVHETKARLHKEDIEEQNWVKTKLTELHTVTQDMHDLESLGTSYLQALSPMIDANYGVIYLKETKERQPYLRKLATYGGDKAKEKIEIGEDLVGQCLENGQIIHLQPLVKDEMKVTTGMVEARINQLIILPIQQNDEILAILELASINHFSGPYEELLDGITDQLGIVMNRIQKQMEVKELLGQTQELNEELQDQSEELQLQQEELRTMNEELEAQYKQSEQRLQELQEAKLALEEKTKQVLLGSQYKSEFLANMSHELRTPLNSLLVLAQILLDNKEGNLTDKQQEYANTIYSAGKELLELINEILDLAKIESGKVEVELTETNVKEIVSLVKKQFHAIAEQKGIQYEVEVEHDVPTYILSDEQKVYQVLKNLVSNALKFTENGKVTMKVMKAIQGERELIAFSVIDTGIGVPENKRGLIFEAFQQADGTSSRKYGGTGLGLSISQGMAELLGGTITLESKKEQGSIFTLYLPVDVGMMNSEKEVAAAVESGSVGENKQGRMLFSEMNNKELENLIPEKNKETENILAGHHVLLVDDDMRNVYALTVALEDFGLNVHFAENGKEALKILEEKADIDLVLTDIMMPELDGYETIKAIRNMKEYERLPVIALTAKAMKEDRQKCIEAGASDYISKPVNLENLLSLLKVWLY
ncbi:response regulator [Bacillus sp. B15-48]|uniref:response regulator n=1 Tax=Bacillus sp. B15-48 TaxID=1548601 RepID=UPI00193F07B3|nr:response regulator [Bacillus sp. B15-48]MBM4761054.1 response regulator [Bacillus sp. B15-48]